MLEFFIYNFNDDLIQDNFNDNIIFFLKTIIEKQKNFRIK